MQPQPNLPPPVTVIGPRHGPSRSSPARQPPAHAAERTLSVGADPVRGAVPPSLVLGSTARSAQRQVATSAVGAGPVLNPSWAGSVLPMG